MPKGSYGSYRGRTLAANKLLEEMGKPGYGKPKPPTTPAKPAAKPAEKPQARKQKTIRVTEYKPPNAKK